MKRIWIAVAIAALAIAPAAYAKPKAKAAVEPAAEAEAAAEAETVAEAEPESLSPAEDSAPAEPGPFSVDLTSGAYFYLLPTTENVFLDMALLFLSLRVGATIDFEYSFGGGFGAGAEVGLLYFPSDENLSFQIFDIPIRAKASISAGEFKAELYAGVLYSIYADSSGAIVGNTAEAGLRIGFWRIYLEAAYNILLGEPIGDGIPRFGAGAWFPIIR